MKWINKFSPSGEFVHSICPFCNHETKTKEPSFCERCGKRVEKETKQDRLSRMTDEEIGMAFLMCL